ncbi:MAG TPA: hypothetical protein VK753_01310, partial [Xanthomonadaceae bacterium]|nr:hypothetical protein [Xanthomonadaceae bacterium]
HYVASAELQSVGKQLDALSKRTAADPTRAALAKQLTDFTTKLAPFTSGEVEDSIKLDAIGGALIALEVDLEATDRAPTEPQRSVLAQYSMRLDRALAAWSSIKSTDLPALNATLHAAGLEPIRVPPRAKLPVIDPGESRDLP